MTTLVEFMIIAGADNRPPMLEKSLCDSWKSHDGTIRTKKYEELSATEKIQADCDCKATNIILQGLLLDVYVIVNHHKVAKEIWDRVKLLMQGTKLSLQEKECKLYDEFDKFTFVKCETLSHKFVTDVKLARYLHTTNYDQLYSYLEQHESQVNHQTNSVPRIAYHSLHASTQPMTEFPQMDSGLAVHVFNLGDDPIACLNKAMAFLTAVASSRFPSTNNQLRTSSNPRNQATIQDDKVTMQQVQGRQGQSYTGNSYKGNATSLEGNNTGGQARVVKCYNFQSEGHMARQCTRPKRPRNAAWFKENAMLAEAQEARQILDEEQLVFLADQGIPDGQAAQTTIPNTTAFQTKDLDAYDSNCDDVSNAKAVLMANLSSYGSDVLSEVPHSETSHNDLSNQSVHAIQDIEQTLIVDFSNNEITSDSNIIPYSQYLQETQLADVQDTNLYAQQDSMILSVIEKCYQNSFYLKKAQRIKPTLYDGSVISSQHVASPVIDDEETLILEELNRLSEDFGKHFVPQQELSDEQAFWLQTSHPNTDQSTSSSVKIKAPRELSKTLKDIFNVFDKDLLNEVTEVQTVFNQMEAAVQQYFVDKQYVMICVMNSIAVFDDVNVEMQSSESCVKCLDLDAELLNKQNAYNDLSKSYSQLEKHCISLELTMQLNQEIFQKESFTNNQNALEIPEYFENNDLKAQLQAKDTTICKLKEHIKSMRENDKEEKVKHEMDKIETINIELEHSVAKLLSENERLHKEIEHLKKIYKDQFDSIKKTRALSKEHDDSLIGQLNSKSMENADLKRQIQDKVFVITSLKNDLRKLKGKETVENVAQIPIATTIAPGMFKIDLEPLAPRLLNNREAHIDYLKHTQEQADILRGIVKQAKAKQPLDNALDFACKHAKRIQELLVYVRDTCPNAYKPSEKMIVVTPMNKIKKVRSQPTGNKKNDRISQKPSSNRKNKVEAQPRKVNKKNRVKEPICDDNVKHTMLNANSQLICVKCKQCMFDANHDVCFLDFVNDVNVRSKSKSAKKSQQHNIWKPTGKVFTDVELKWKPTGRLFTIVGNSCPLTRITPKKTVHLKETTSNSVKTPKLEIKVYSRRPKQIKSVGSSKKAKIVESKIANNSKPNYLWGSNATDVPSSSSFVNDCPDCS
ncbi:hypothetical protein Tco_0909428 [Tanacetum coccineum]|uniref:Integrase, catalytic region, zinc finger, CCHC-type, peptidase aspartic, catalytic n=1 Tax=Tanacetum coccineum TaxID=301880 RepID=A0ABQ5CQG9_9ASTR